MKTNEEPEGIIEADELPVTVPKEEPVKTDEVIPEVIADSPPADVPEIELVLPGNIQTDDEIPVLKPEAEKAEEKQEPEKPEEKADPAEEIFDEKLFEEKAEEKAEEPAIANDTFVAEFLTETKDIFGDVEIKTAKDLAERVKAEIENAKTKVEIDTSKYTAEQLAVFDYLKEENSVTDFADVTKVYVDFLAKTDDEKMEAYLIHEKGMTDPTERREEFDRLVDEDKWDATINQINQTIVNLKNQAIQERVAKLATDRAALTETTNKVVESERKQLETTLDEMTDFMDFPLPATFKQQLKKEIETGLLTKKNNNASTQLKARLFDLVGARILAQHKANLEAEKNAAYERGLLKGQGALHNTPPIIDKPGHQKSKDFDRDEKAGFRNIDSDAIST